MLDSSSDEGVTATVETTDRREGAGAAWHLAGLALAGLLALGLWLGVDGVGDKRSPSTRPSEAATTGRLTTAPTAVPPTAPADADARARSAGTATAEDDAGFPAREPLAGLIGARERFGDAFTIRQPTYLPAGIAPFTVNWQPDSDPRRRAAGYGDLLSWFSSAADGAVLVLVQGPGVGIRPLTAPDDRAGRLRLADGTELIWVVGHPLRVTNARDGAPTWAGTEITLGVAAGAGEGWYLRSPSLPLAELMRIAESLRPFDGG